MGEPWQTRWPEEPIPRGVPVRIRVRVLNLGDIDQLAGVVRLRSGNVRVRIPVSLLPLGTTVIGRKDKPRAPGRLSPADD